MWTGLIIGSMWGLNLVQCVDGTNYWFNEGIEPGSMCIMNQLLVQCGYRTRFNVDIELAYFL